MVAGIYITMLLAQTLLKLEDGASNMATRSQLAAWMDAVIRALRVDFAKDMEPTVVAMSSIVQVTRCIVNGNMTNSRMHQSIYQQELLTHNPR
jgi:hypothetical protein